MDEAIALNVRGPAVRIGIRGLTHTKSMLGGGIYLLIAETTSARFPMLAGCVAAAFEDGLQCTLIVPGNTAQFIQRIERLAKINTAELASENRLQIFVTQDNFLKKMFQFGAERFVEELEDFGILENSFLIFDQADELLSMHDISLAQEQVNVLKDWFAKKGITALLVFSRFTDAHNNTVNAIMDSLGGIVRLGGTREGLELKFDYWQSPTSVIAAKNYQIETLDSGLYKASTKVTAPDPIDEDENEEGKPVNRQALGYESGLHYSTRKNGLNLERFRGYLKPLNFMQEVSRILAESDSVNIGGTLIVGIPQNGTEVSDIIRRFDRSSRLGELITVGDRQCYIYLNVDSNIAVLGNLEVVLGLPVGTVFGEYRFLNKVSDIRLEMDALSYIVQLRTYTDFSLMHDVSVPLESVQSDRWDVSKNLNNKSTVVESKISDSGRILKLSDKSYVLDFEHAKRSVNLDPDFQSIEDAAFMSKNSDINSEILFDFDLESPVFEKNKAPRAKRTKN